MGCFVRDEEVAGSNPVNPTMQSLDFHEEFQGFLFFKLCEMFLGTIWVPREKRIWQNGDVKNFQLPNSYQLKIKITLKGLCLFCLICDI